MAKNIIPKTFDLNDTEVLDAILYSDRAAGSVQAGHPHLQLNIIWLKDGQSLIDDPWTGKLVFLPAEVDPVRWVRNQTTHLDGTEPGKVRRS